MPQNRPGPMASQTSHSRTRKHSVSVIVEARIFD